MAAPADDLRRRRLAVRTAIFIVFCRSAGTSVVSALIPFILVGHFDFTSETFVASGVPRLTEQALPKVVNDD